jgi:hypothetical protein
LDYGDRVASVWRSLRAALITLLLALGFVAGWPKVSPKLLARLPPGMAQVARKLPDTQRSLLAPFAPVADAFGIESQNWAVFATTGGIRHRMWVEARARRGHTWTLLHRAQDDEHAYLRETLEYRRLRVLWNPHRYGVAAGYPAFTRWLARRVFLDFPHFDRVRVRQEQVEILPRGAGFRTTGTFAYELEYSRRELLP